MSADIVDVADVTKAYVDEPTVVVAIEVGWRNFCIATCTVGNSYYLYRRVRDANVCDHHTAKIFTVSTRGQNQKLQIQHMWNHLYYNKSGKRHIIKLGSSTTSTR